MLLCFCWCTVVYDPIAYWVWNPSGWAMILGDLDFAGGGVVHINSGVSALVISYYLGRRRGYGTEKVIYNPHNVTYVVLGTVLLWFGWFGCARGALCRPLPLHAETKCAASTAARPSP